MDVITYIQHELKQAHLRIATTAQGLSQEQLAWRPFPGANPIGFLMWHIPRVVDGMSFPRLFPDRHQVWIAGAWPEKFGLPPRPDLTGMGFSDQEVEGFPMPPLETLLGYLDATYEDALRYVGGLKPWDLDKVMDPQRGSLFGGSLRHTVTHANFHHGQMDYVRGLIQQGWSLPGGLGIVVK